MNRGLAYGDGFFTTLRLQSGAILFEAQHKARLKQTAERLNLAIDEKQVDSIFTEIKQQRSEIAQMVKILATVNCESKGYQRSGLVELDWQITKKPLGEISTQFNIIRCQQTIPYLHQLAGLKTISALHYVMAANEWAGMADEGLILDSEGYVIEACMNNIVLMNDKGALWTPCLENAGINGVFRTQLIEYCQREQIDLEISSLRYDEMLADCQGFWLMNSVRGLRPVINCDNHTIKHSETAQLFYNQVNENWQALCQGNRTTL